MGLYDSDRFVCFKGLDSGNGLLVEIPILSLDVAYLVTSADEDNPSKATIFTKLYHTRTLVGVIRTAGHVLDSNLVEGLTMTSVLFHHQYTNRFVWQLLPCPSMDSHRA